MALNLRSKLPENSVLHIHDISTDVLGTFAQHFGNPKNIVIAKNAAEVVKQSV